MGKGINLAALDNPAHAAAIDNMKDQLIIVLIKRLGGKVSIPAIEIDKTGGDLLYMHLEGASFNFEVKGKH